MADQSEEKKEYYDSCGFVNYKAQAGDLWSYVILYHVFAHDEPNVLKIYIIEPHTHITLHITDLTLIMDI